MVPTGGINRLGLTLPLPGLPLAAHRDLVERLVGWGYSDLFTAEVAGTDAFTPLAAAAAWSPELRLGTAIASVFARGPALLAMEAASLAELAPGRFVLGIGSSSPLVVEGWNAGRLHRPLTRMRDTLLFLGRAFAGERIDEVFETFAVRGFALERPPSVAPSLMLAALGPRMLALAGAASDGAILGLLMPQDVPALAKTVRNTGPGSEIAMRIGVVPTRDIETARHHCRRILAAYLNVPAYAALHTDLGRGEIVQAIQAAWKSGDRAAAVGRVPPEWSDEFFAIGPPERCRERIERFCAAGVSTPILSIMQNLERPDAVLPRLSGVQ